VGRCSVLVVDDDPFILETVAEFLRDEGYSVQTAHSALEAARATARRHHSVVLLDIRMPGLDGSRFALELRARDQTPKILVMTAAHTARKVAMEIGADGYIEKPFELEDLVGAIEGARGNEYKRPSKPRATGELL
jgi:DNA-binding response OmpR family regulator